MSAWGDTQLTVLPDIVALAVAVLKADPATSGLVGNNIGSRQPDVDKLATLPSNWIKVTRIGGSPPIRQRLDRAYVQFSCYATASDRAAMDLARSANAALWASPGFSNGEGIITSVDPMEGLMQLNDTSRTPALPRVIFTLILSARPA